MKTISATALRSDIYNLLDEVIDSGETIFIERNGAKVELSNPGNKDDILSKLTPRKSIVGDPENLVTFSVFDSKQINERTV